MSTQVHTIHNVQDQITIRIECPGTRATTKTYNLSNTETIAHLKAMIARDFDLPAASIGLAFRGCATPTDLADSNLVTRIPDRTTVVVHDKRTVDAGEQGTTPSQVPHRNHIENNELNLDRTAVRSETDGGAMMVNALVAPSDDGRPHDNAIRGNKMTGGIMWNAAGALGSLKGDNPVFRAISVNK